MARPGSPVAQRLRVPVLSAAPAARTCPVRLASRRTAKARPSSKLLLRQAARSKPAAARLARPAATRFARSEAVRFARPGV